MQIDSKTISKLNCDFEKRGTFRLVQNVALGLSFVLVTINPNEIKGFDDQPICSLQVVIQDKREVGKVCTRCLCWRLSSEYHRNKSKKDQLESHCRSYVSKRNERRRKKQRRANQKCFEFESVIVGAVDDDVTSDFADIFGSTLQEVLNGGQAEAH